MKTLFALAIAVMAAVPLAVSADSHENKGHKEHKSHGHSRDSGDENRDESDRDRGDDDESAIHGENDRNIHRSGRHGDSGDEHRGFNDDEREAISGYYSRHHYEEDGDEDHDRGRKDLPPGLRKKEARGEGLPPGWQKKLNRGERIPDDVWEHRQPLPPEIIVRLPPPPGVVLVRVHDHIIRVIERTHEVLDDLGLPHPPTPR